MSRESISGAAAGNRMIVTTLRGRRLTAEETNGRITDLFFEDPEADSMVGRIYVGTVKQIRTNIQAAFVELGDGLMAYYPLEDWERFPVEGVVFREGAQIPVMVTKDAQKTKAPTVTTALTFTGQYLVLTPSKQGLFFSSRLHDPERKQALRALLGEADNYSLIVRTNAAQASDEAILAERDRLLEEAKRLSSVWKTRTSGSLLRSPEPGYLSEIFGNRLSGLFEVVTDLPDVYNKIEMRLQTLRAENPEADLPSLRLYTDSYPLSKLYNLETVLERALSERIWLKSGGFLVIQPTEALVAIDVNTGKTENRRKKEDTIFRTNLEAAKEIAIQLKLRNLSGIILIDFIDMAEDSHKEAVLQALTQELRKDPVKTTVLGYTKLNLVEMTRKKVRKPLHEMGF